MYNKIVMLVLIGFLTYGCSNAEQDKKQDSQEETEISVEKKDNTNSYGNLEELGKEEEQEPEDEQLSPKEKQIKSMLDNPHEPPFLLMGDQKWDADEPTIKRIKNIHEMYKSFIANNRTDYNQFGLEVNEASIEVLDKCNMPEPHKGALYAWMAPIISYSGMLRDTKNDKLNSRIVKKAEEKLSEFDKFFQ